MSMYASAYVPTAGSSIGDVLRDAVKGMNGKEQKDTASKVVLLIWEWEGAKAVDGTDKVMPGRFVPRAYRFTNETTAKVDILVSKGRAYAEYKAVWRRFSDTGMPVSVHSADGSVLRDSFEYVRSAGYVIAEGVKIQGNEKRGIAPQKFVRTVDSMNGTMGEVRMIEGNLTVIPALPEPKEETQESTSAEPQTDAIEGTVTSEDTAPVRRYYTQKGKNGPKTYHADETTAREHSKTNRHAFGYDEE